MQRIPRRQFIRACRFAVGFCSTERFACRRCRRTRRGNMILCFGDGVLMGAALPEFRKFALDFGFSRRTGFLPCVAFF